MKDVLAEVLESGGNPIEHSVISPTLVQQVKKEVLVFLQKATPSNVKPRRIRAFVQEEFVEGRFEEGLRATFIFLMGMGITDPARISSILLVVAKRHARFETSLDWRKEQELDGLDEFDDGLTMALVDVWEGFVTPSGHTYRYAETRFLIEWDYGQGKWSLTNLGRLFLTLRPFHATVLLFSLDKSLSTGPRDERHPSPQLLRALMEVGEEDVLEIDPYGSIMVKPRVGEEHDVGSARDFLIAKNALNLHSHLLSEFGIISITENNMGYPIAIFEVTSIGRRVLLEVLDEMGPLTEVIRFFSASEGDVVDNTGLMTQIEKIQEAVVASTRLAEEQKKSFVNSMELALRGQFPDALKLLFPFIEGVLNILIHDHGKVPSDYRGLWDKINFLVRNGTIPDECKAFEIVFARNKIVHGEYSPPDSELAFPLFQMAILYLTRLFQNGL